MGSIRRVLLTAAVATIFVAACGGREDTATDKEGNAAPGIEAAAPATTAPTDESPGRPALVARTSGELAVHAGPAGAHSHTLPATTDFGSPRALLVTQEQEEWLEVALPERPNGSTGWVRRDDVDLRSVQESIEIDLTTRTLTLLEGDREVLTTTVAIGTEDHPTPTGEYYVVDKLATDDPEGAYGPFAFGISAFSETLTEFAGGDGQVGIHGTNDPATIGDAVSHGCVRVPNEIAETLNERLHLGTPVIIS